MLLSGYLLLDREYNKDRIIKFWKRNMMGLLISTEIWIFIYYIFVCWLYKQKLQIDEIVPRLLFFKNANANHLWYMGQIIGIYLFLLITNTAKLLKHIVIINKTIKCNIPDDTKNCLSHINLLKYILKIL